VPSRPLFDEFAPEATGGIACYVAAVPLPPVVQEDHGLSEGQAIAARIRKWDAGEARGPYTMELYPTMTCNIDCVFCDTTYRKGKQTGELSPDDYWKLLDEARDLGVRRVFVLGGGEPLVRKDVTPELMRRVKAFGMEGHIATNGTLFDEALIAQVLDTRWDELHFSLDAPDPAVNDYLRGRAGVFAKVAQTMCRIHGLKHKHGLSVRDAPRMLIHAVVTNKNHRLLADMVRFARAVGAYRVNFDYIIAYRPEQHALKLSVEEREEMPALAREGLAVAEALGIETTLGQFLETRALDRGEMTFPQDGPEDAAHAPCLNPWYYLVVQPNGKVSPCCVITGTGEDVRAGLSEVWTDGDYFSSLRASMRKKEMTDLCRNCSMSIIARNDYIRDHLGTSP
jgi:radical SAM protein with 4Fe4S-binding SPASM domain